MSAFVTFSFTPIAVLLFASAGVALLIAWLSWSKQERYSSAATLGTLMLTVSIWVISYALEIITDTLAPMAFWETISTIAQAFIGPLWLILAIQYTNLNSWLTSRRIVLLLFPGIITVLLAVTNSAHHLLWSGLAIHNTANYSVMIPLAGPWFWALAVYRYIYLLIGSVVILIPLARSPASYSKQGVLIGVGGLLPLVGNALHIFNLTGAMVFDIGPLAFVVSGIALYLGLFTFRLLDVLPLAQHAIFSGLPEGIIVLAPGNEIIDINPAARAMLGISLGSTPLHTHLADVIEPDTLLKLQEASDTKGEFSVGHSPALRWLSPARSPLTDSQDKDRGEVLMLYDVTEVHNLAQFREDLVHMMVHDLRNPLTIAQGSLELLADESFTTLDPTARQLVDMVQHSTQQCLDLVRKILDLQQLESGKLMLEPEDLALLPYVSQQVLQMRPLADMKRQELLVDISPALPPLKADPRLLERILQNLIGNAIKFTPEDGTIRVSARLRDKMAEISVADTGPGITEELRRDLFEKFVTGKHRNRGSGLGLAFCRLAVEAHGGEIWVDSVEEKGSVFRFTLPFDDVDALPLDDSVPFQLSLLGQDAGQPEESLG